jgi:hypothetical protein
MSALGDGMSAVAIAWLALKLAPPGSRGLWVGAAVAAYSLPGAAGAVALRRWLRGRGGARLAFVNAVLRAAALGLIGCLAIARLLDPEGYVALLGTFWAVFGVGAVIGELTAPFLRHWPVWPTMTGIVLGWGLAIVPLGLRTPLWAGLAAFFAGAVIWGPWTSLSMAVFQDASPPAALAQVIAARSSLLILASPLGTALGGPVVAALGARGTLLTSALATITLGVITIAVLARARARKAGIRE